MAIPPFVSVPIAGVILFDNSTNGFASQDVQAAIEEASATVAFNPDTILTGPTDCLYFGPVAPLDVLIDSNGNVLIG